MPATRPFSFISSLYYKLSAALLLVLIVFGVSLSIGFGRHSSDRAYTGLQILYWETAENLAEKFGLKKPSAIDFKALLDLSRELRLLNPIANVFLITKEGSVHTYFGDPKLLERESISLEPIERFFKTTAKQDLPIYGDDPLDEERQSVFSVARVFLGDEPAFLYLVYDSRANSVVPQLMIESYFGTSAIFVFGGAGLLAFLTGLLIFFVLTRRLNTLSKTVREFKEGNLKKRVRVRSRDEIGTLGATYNEMADTIAAQVDELANTDRIRRELVSGMSHDLRLPLSAARGYLEEFMLRDVSLSEEQKEKNIRSAFKSVESVVALVNELFEYSKLDAKEKEPELEPLALGAFLDDVIFGYEALARNNDISLSLDVADGLPLVMADVTMLERVFGNLISNAIRYTPEGGAVKVSAKGAGDAVLVAVSDTGIGIKEADLPLVFDRFYRTQDGAEKDMGGTGLGLAVVKKILEAHGSDIEVSSVFGEGTTFSFKLPAQDENSE